MLRFLCLPLLGFALVAQSAGAQTTPAARKATTKAKTTTRMVPNNTPAARRADPLRGTNDNGAGDSGYAAPGEPVQMPGSGGKNTATYDGQPAKTTKNSTLSTPK